MTIRSKLESVKRRTTLLQLVRILLLLLILALPFIMAEFPPVYYPHRIAPIRRSYNERKTDSALHELQLAEQAVRRVIVFIESALGIIFIGSILLFRRAGRYVKHDQVVQSGDAAT